MIGQFSTHKDCFPGGEYTLFSTAGYLNNGSGFPILYIY